MSAWAAGSIWVPSENDRAELFGPGRPHVGYRVVARGTRDTGISGVACACWVDYNLLHYPYLRTHPALSQYAVFLHPGRRVHACGLGVCASVRRVWGKWMEGARYEGRDVRSVAGVTRSVVPIVITRLTRKTKETVCFWPAAKNNAKTMQNQFIACPVNSQFTHKCGSPTAPMCVE